MAEKAKNRWIETLSILVIGIYPFLFIRHGIDFTDFGFLLTNYLFIFDSPENVQYGFGYWLTYVIGGLILKLSNPYGALFIRIAYAITIVLTSWMSFKILKPIIKPRLLLPVLALSTLVITNNLIETWLSYNNLTSLIFVLAALFLLKDTEQPKIKYFIIGFLIGSSIFIRFPNIIMTVLPVVYLLFEKYYHEKKTIWIVYGYIWYFAGTIVAFVLSYILMYLLGHETYYLNGLYGLSTAIGEVGTGTSGKVLFRVFLFGNFKLLVKALFIFAWVLILFKSFNISGLKRIKSIFIFLKVAGVGVVLLFVFKLEWSWINLTIVFLLPLLARFIQLVKGRKLLYVLSSIFLLISLLIAFRYSSESSSWKSLPVLYAILLYKCIMLFRRGDDSLKYYVVGLALLLITPIGSSLGLYNSYLGMWIALPLSLWVIYDEIGRINIKWEKNNKIAKGVYIIFLVILVSISSVVHDYQHTWRDASKSELNSEFNNSNINHLLTTKFNVDTTTELLAELDKHVDNGESIIAYNEIPIVHYMTETKPFLNNPWPQLVSPSYINTILDSSFSNIEEYPVIVRKLGPEEWPTNGKIGTISKMDDYFFELGYLTIWQNGRYKIMKK